MPRGRPKGCDNSHLIKGWYQKCAVCPNEFWNTPKASATHKYCSRKCQHEDPVWIEKLRMADKSYTQTESFSKSQQKETTPLYKKYKGKVHRLSEKIYMKHKEQINPNNYKRTLCGVTGGYQLDHIKPIWDCFEQGVPPEQVADISNLRMLPWRENVGRNKK